MKVKLFILLAMQGLACAQSKQDLRDLENRVDELEAQQRRTSNAAKRAEEDRLLALPLDPDLQEKARKAHGIQMGDNLGQTRATIRNLLLQIARIQESRNLERGLR